MSTVTAWVHDHQGALIATAVLLLVAAVALPVLRSRRARTTARTPAAVIVAALGALACTAYSGDTSWRFAEHQLDMTSLEERAALFLAAELALFACALMARQNLRDHGVPGVPGTLVWFITGVQVIPAYSESGIVGGTVRAVVGPILAALLWHLAMGIELRHGRPGATSQSLPAVIARELRERTLSRLGLATRDRTAAQITRDRATHRAVQLASRPNLHRWGKARLAAAVARAGVGTDPEQRDTLMQLLAARRGATALPQIALPSPWEQPVEDTVEDAQDVEDAATVPAVPPFPRPVPPGARLLPIVARPAAPAPDPQDGQDAAEDGEDGDDGPPPEPPLMTSADVADHYGIKTSTVRNWVAAGRIPVHAKDATGRNLFHPDELPNFQVAVPV
ncbi:helix-turn-helix domain-containing protein [Streptomyces olivaceus]|uniref:helix-turn-helix domain-containing protein n=1 Tax=Streptomyces olivaceus TaxID=47716 RepID=UPI002A2D84B5|nr:helix-turn-helix domain-containing protein [Streptomyces olivaceus]